MGAHMYRLSVILPVYNAEPWLEECVESIRASAGDCFGDLELLLINDGSTDASGAICTGLAEKYGNLRVFHKANGGVASARNMGLDNASGQYIAWVDPDDTVSPDWCGRIFDAIGQGEPDLIVMDSLRFSAGKETPEIYGRPAGFLDRDLFAEDVIRDLRMLSGMPNKVIKARVFDGCRFDTSLLILEDFALIPQLLERIKTVYYIPECLYRYRQHEGSLLHTAGAPLAFRAVRTALDQEAAVPPRFRSAAVTAAAMQAFRFCWNHYNVPEFGAEKDQLRFCRKYIRHNLGTILRDPELSGSIKLKLLLTGIGLFGILVSVRKR